MLSRRGLLLAVGAGALALWALPNLPYEDLKARYYRVFPRDFVLFVYDPSSSGKDLRNLDRAYPGDRQRHDGLRIIVQPINESEILGSIDEVLDAFGRTPSEPSSSRLFLRLSPPLGISMKKVRADLDAQNRYTGEDRVRLLGRIVPTFGGAWWCGADGSATKSTPCQQFEDDLAYSEWNFGGFGLRMDDQTFQLLHECLAKALLEHYVAKRCGQTPCSSGASTAGRNALVARLARTMSVSFRVAQMSPLSA